MRYARLPKKGDFGLWDPGDFGHWTSLVRDPVEFPSEKPPVKGEANQLAMATIITTEVNDWILKVITFEANPTWPPLRVIQPQPADQSRWKPSPDSPALEKTRTKNAELFGGFYSKPEKKHEKKYEKVVHLEIVGNTSSNDHPGNTFLPFGGFLLWRISNFRPLQIRLGDGICFIRTCTIYIYIPPMEHTAKWPIAMCDCHLSSWEWFRTSNIFPSGPFSCVKNPPTPWCSWPPKKCCLYTSPYFPSPVSYVCVYVHTYTCMYVCMKDCSHMGGFLKWGYPKMDGL